jgi:RNA polymerase sigma factor (sigma-70 family)
LRPHEPERAPPLEEEVAAVRAGDADAERRLWERAGRFLTRIGLAAGVRPDDLPDLVQDALAAAHAALDRFDPEIGSFEAWLGTIFARRTRNLARGRRRWREAARRLLGEARPTGGARAREALEARWVLDRLVGCLSRRERQVVALYEIGELDARETARILDVTPETVRSTARHARRKLARAADRLGPG